MKNKVLTRIITGISIFLGLVLVLLMRELLTIYIVDFFLLAVLILAVNEVMRAAKVKERGIKPHYVFSYIICAFLVFFIGSIVKSPFGLLLHLISQSVILLIFIVYTFFMYYVDTSFLKQCRLKKLKIGAECRRIMAGYLKIIGYPTAFFYALFALNHFSGAAPAALNMGAVGLLMVFLISAATDTCAYAVGSLLKGPKLCPKISPKKTWAGAVGGLFGGIIITLTLVFFVSGNKEFGAFFLEKGIDAWLGLVVFGFIGLVGSAVTQAGDIFASSLKRKHGIKDFGKMLPGHGGVMDRLDGNIFCAVFIFITLSIICFIL